MFGKKKAKKESYYHTVHRPYLNKDVIGSIAKEGYPTITDWYSGECIHQKDKEIGGLNDDLKSCIDSARSTQKTQAEVIKGARAEIEKLQTQLDMLKPLQTFRVLYGDGYEETVRAFGYCQLDRNARFLLADGSLVADFEVVNSVIVIKD